jgi:hypothetical protein
MNPYSKISLVVFTYNEEMRIEDFLRYYDKFPYIYLSDSSSTDSTIKLAKKTKPNIRIIKSKKTDYANRDRIIEALKLIKTEWVFLTVISERLSIALIDNVVHKINQKTYPYEAIKFYRQSYTGSLKTHSNPLALARLILSFYKPSAPIFKKNIFDYNHSRIHREFTLAAGWNNIDIISQSDIYFMFHIRNFSPAVNIYKHNLYASIEAREKILEGLHFSYLRLVLKPILFFMIFLLRDLRSITNPIAFITVVNHAIYIFLVEYYIFYFDKFSDKEM